MPSPVAVPAADRPARAVSRVGTAMEGARRFLFGHDVFISYARADALEYAQALADALTKHRLSTYVDQLGTPPGPVIPPLLLLRLRLSGMLVLVGSPGAAASQAVAQEVETFVQRNHRLFVVDVEGALDGTAWYRDRIRGGPARRVTRAELAGGVPSEPVVEQVLKNVDFARREDRLRRTMRYTLGGIGTMLVLGAAGALVLNARAADLGRQAAAASAAVDSLGHVGAALTLAQRAGAAADGSADGWVRSLLLSAESLREAWTVDGAGAWLRGMSVLSPSLGAVRSHGVPIQSLAVSGDGRRMATGGADGRLRIWDVAESGGRVSATPRGNTLAVAGRGPVTALAFSADGRMLASGFGEWLVVWGVDGPRAVPRLLRPMRGTVHGLAFTPDGRTLAVGETYHARLVETGGWRDTLLPETPQRAGIGVAFSPDGRWLAVGGGGQTELWDVASRTLLGVARVGGRQLGFAGGGTALVADGAWVPIAGGPAAPTLGTPGAPAVEGGAQPLAASRDGRFVARASSIGGTGLVDAAGRDLARMPVEPASTLAWRVVAFGPGGRWMAVGTDSGTVTFWPGTPGNASALLPHGAPAHSLSFSPDGQWLSIALANGRMRVLRPGTWGEAFRDAAAPSAQFTADGRWLVAVGDSVVRVYRPGDWERMPDLVHEAPVEGVWASPDGTRLATRQEGSFSRGPGVTRPTRMRVWDAASGRLLGWRDEPEHDRARGWYRRDGYDASAPAEGGRTDLAHQALQWPLVRSAPDSPRGGWNVVLRERTVALVDDGTGRPVAEIDPAHGNLRDAEVSPDGAWLATAGEDGTVRLWRIGGAREMIAEACARVPRNLTRAEWERLFPGRPYRRTCPALPDPPDLATPPDTTPRQAEG